MRDKIFRDLSIRCELELKAEKLVVKIINKYDDENFYYACYLQNGKGENIEKQYYKRQNIFEFVLKKYDEYQCVCFVKRGDEISYRTTERIMFLEPQVICVLGDRKVADLLYERQSDYEIKLLEGKNALLLMEEKDLHLKNSKEEDIIFSIYDEWEGELTEDNLKELIEGIRKKAPCANLFYNEMYFDEKDEELFRKNERLKNFYNYLDRAHIQRINTHQLVMTSGTGEYYYENEQVFAIECLRQMEKFAEESREKYRKNFEVRINIVGQKLKIEIISNGSLENKWYCYYIVKDGKVYYKHSWENCCSFEYELKENGVYSVWGYIKEKDKVSLKKSVPFEFFTEQIREKYEEFLKEEGDNKGDQIPFFHGNDPVANFSCLVSKCGIDINISIEGFQLNAYKAWGGVKAYLYSDKGLKENNGEKFLFSGSAVIDHNFIIGQAEIDVKIPREQIVCNAGCYTYLNITDNDIYIGTDMFGFNRLFYFENDSLFLVSNRYHLLLLTMKEAGIAIIPDLPKMLSHFSAINFQPLLQGMTNKMDVSGVWQLEKYLNIVINARGIEFVKNEYGKILEEENHLTEVEYRRELYLAKEEILDNIQAVFRRNDFFNIIVDLSGGLDSRIIYGLLDEVENSRERTKIRSNDVTGSCDLDIAIKINNIYSYEYDDMARIFGEQSTIDMYLEMRSFYMGIYFSWMELEPTVFEKCDGAIRLLGSCGEILARPYLTRNFIGTYLEDCKTAKEFFEGYVKELSEYFICGYECAISPWIDLMSEEAGRQIEDTFFEAYERMYLQTRHGYHFDDIFGWNSIPFFGPLQSKKMFRLHHLTYNEFRSLKLQFDLLRIVDAKLAEIPYESEKDNEHRKEIYNMLYTAQLEKGEVILSDDRSRWVEANKRKEERTTGNAYITFSVDKKMELRNNLRRLCKIENGYFGKRIGVALFYFMENHEDNRSICWLNNKVVSVLDQLEIE